jgi:tetratricopeptide (TPR) repeat protein
VARGDGVPFFIEELLAAALGEADSWRLVPGSIAAAVDARLRLLPESTGRFLGFAAMLGRNFDWHVVAAAAGCPPLEAIDRLRQAARAQLIDTDGAGFRFRHALTAEAVRSSLLPEERQAICANLLETLQLLHPGLEGETCQLAASLAVEVGDQLRAADLWLEAARRALPEGSLGSAEALALRALGARPLAADRVLLSTWTIAGQPRRALEAGRRILSVGDCDLADRIEVLLELVDAMITAGRWYDAESYLETLRSAPGLDRSGAARRAIGEAEVALARNDNAAAVAFARAALADARDNGLAEVTCRALWVIGRVERGSGTDVARAAFEEAYECASRNALPVFRVKSLQELGTIDMFETLGTARRRSMLAGPRTLPARSTDMIANPAGNASFTAAFSVDQTPQDVFHAINNVRGWWSEDIEGGTEKAGDEFNYRYQDVHRCRIKVTELVPGERVAWRVLDNYFDFTQDKAEWKDTEIHFEITARDGKTRQEWQAGVVDYNFREMDFRHRLARRVPGTPGVSRPSAPAGRPTGAKGPA